MTVLPADLQKTASVEAAVARVVLALMAAKAPPVRIRTSAWAEMLGGLG